MSTRKIRAYAAVAALSLILTGLIAGGGALSASADTEPPPAAPGAPLGHFPVHQPLACKKNEMGGCARHVAVGGSWINPNSDWATDGTYAAVIGTSSYSALNDPSIFPDLSSGYNCLEEATTLFCVRSNDLPTVPGKKNPTIDDLVTAAGRGSLLTWSEDDGGGGGHMDALGRSMITLNYHFAEADATVLQPINATGTLGLPFVMWTTKSQGFVGVARSFLTGGGSGAPSASELQAPATLSSTSFISPGTVTAVSPGQDITYGLSLRATKPGAAVVRLTVDGLKDISEVNVPSDWLAFGSFLTSNTVSYLVPELRQDELSAIALSGEADDSRHAPSVTAFINTDDENSGTEREVTVKPDAPVCVTTEKPVVPTGGVETILDGVVCHSAPGTTLTSYYTSGNQGALTALGDGWLSYRAYEPTFAGEDTAYVYATDAAGHLSTYTAVPLTVVANGTPVADDYTVTAEQSLVIDVEHGMRANDVLPGGTQGWYVQTGRAPANGELDITDLDGAFSYTPNPGFSGDDSFRYRLDGPNGYSSQTVTVTIHVIA